MANGSFPKPIRLSERAVGWKSDDIDAWLAARPMAAA
jgi:prophage regulatory protein